MSALFFGDSAQPLFGYFHPPRGRSRDTGVLLCGPAPQEYMRTHWAFRKLADMLARAGFAAFRFDYHGTGDSAGDSGSGSPERWRLDVKEAAQELADLASTRRVSAVGFRMGALLASTAGVRFRDLILWEPVVSGERYLNELLGVQKHYLRLNPRPAWRLADRPEELLGFPSSGEQEAVLRTLALDALPRPQAERVWVMVSKESSDFRRLVDAWRPQGETTLVEVEEESGAATSGDVQAALLSNVMLNAIVQQLT